MRKWCVSMWLLTAGASAAWAEGPAAPAAVPLKPEVRSVQLRAKQLVFDVTLRPGAPDVGQLVEVTIEAAELPPVPDPIYGERIPVKQAQMVAEVTDADGAGYTTTYLVHALADAGSYGFHFTPVRKDNYRVVLRGKPREADRSFESSLRLPVGIWPFTLVDEQGRTTQVPARPASSRAPAMPSGMTPTSVAGNAAYRPLAGRVRSLVAAGMVQIGELWARLGEAMLLGRKGETKLAEGLAAELEIAVRDLYNLQAQDAQFVTLLKDLSLAAGGLRQLAASGKGDRVIEAFQTMGREHCNRCHLIKRWKILSSLDDFPAGLQ